MRWLRRLLYLIVGLVFFAYLFLRFLLPWALTTQYARHQIEKSMSDALRRPVKLIPKLQVSWKLAPRLSLGDLLIGDPAGFSDSPPLLRLKSAEAGLNVWKLLKGGVLIPVLKFENGEVNLISDKDGENNWSFARAEEGNAQSKDDAGTQSGAFWLPQIELINLAAFKIHYIDRRSSKDTGGTIEKLTIRRFGSGATIDIATSASFDVRAFELEAHVGPLPNLFQRQEWPVKFELKHAGQKLAADGYIALGDAGEFSGKARAEVSGTALEKVLDSFGIEPVPEIPDYKITGDFSYRDGLLEFNLADSKIASLQLSASGKVSFLHGGTNGNISASVSGPDLQNLLNGFGIASVPPIKQFKITASANKDERAVKLNLEQGQFDDLRIESEMTHLLTGPGLQGSIDAHNLDLTRLLPSGPEPAPTPAKEKNNRYIFSEEPFNLSAIEGHQASLALKADNFTLSEGLHVSDLSTAVSVEHGELRVADLLVHMGDGSLNGNATIGNNAASIELRGSNLPFDKISRGSKRGVLDFDLNLQGAGNSPRAIVSSLKGKIDVRIRDVELTGGGLVYSTSNLFEILNPVAKGKGSVILNCGIARFSVKDGIAFGMGLAVIIGDTSILGDGVINLKKETLSLGFVPKSSSVGVSTVVPPLKVFGSISGPTIMPNPLGLATAQIDNFESVISGGLGAVGGLAGGLGRSVGILEEKKAPEPAVPAKACEELIKENAGRLTTLVGGLVFGTTPVEVTPPPPTEATIAPQKVPFR